MYHRHIREKINFQRRRLAMWLAVSPLVGLSSCGGRGNGNAEGEGGASVNSLSPDTGPSLVQLPQPGFSEPTLALSDTTGPIEGLIDLRSKSPSGYLLRRAFCVDSTDSYQATFSDTGSLESCKALGSGTELLVTEASDHYVFRYYDKTGAFIHGVVVRRSASGAIRAGLLRSESYSAGDSLADEIDPSAKINQVRAELTGSVATSAGINANTLFELMPISAARAETGVDDFDTFANGLALTVGGLVLTVPATIAIGVAVAVLFESATAGAIAVVLMTLLVNMRKANAQPLPGSTLFNGQYVGTTALDGYTHVESNQVSGITVSGHHTFSNGSGSSGAFSWAGTLVKVYAVGSTVKADIVGRGTINNGGTRSFVLQRSSIEVTEAGEATMYWQGVDPLSGRIGGVSKRSG